MWVGSRCPARSCERDTKRQGGAAIDPFLWGEPQSGRDGGCHRVGRYRHSAAACRRVRHFLVGASAELLFAAGLQGAEDHADARTHRAVPEGDRWRCMPCARRRVCRCDHVSGTACRGWQICGLHRKICGQQQCLPDEYQGSGRSQDLTILKGGIGKVERSGRTSTFYEHGQSFPCSIFAWFDYSDLHCYFMESPV